MIVTVSKGPQKLPAKFSLERRQQTLKALKHFVNLTNWIIMQKSQFLPKSASPGVESNTCPGLAHHFHQKSSKIKSKLLQAQEIY